MLLAQVIKPPLPGLPVQGFVGDTESDVVIICTYVDGDWIPQHGIKGEVLLPLPPCFKLDDAAATALTLQLKGI